MRLPSSVIGLLLSSLFGTVLSNSLYKICHPVLLPMDVLFLLDGSGSVSGNTFSMQMEMLRRVAELMRLEENKSRLAVMQYAGYTRLELQFGENKTKEEIMTSLAKIHYMSGSTKTGKALKKARDILKEEKGRIGHSHVKQVVIVVSDGHSHDDPAKYAAALRSDGVSLVVLGIGHHINREELLQITDSEDFAFQNLHKEEQLQNFVKSFSNISQEIECDFARRPRGATFSSDDDSFTVAVSTSDELKGALYVSGRYTDPKCISKASKLSQEGGEKHYDTILKVKYTDCGVKEIITETAQIFTATVILQFDELLATENDVIYEIRSYRDEKSPQFRILDENSLTTFPKNPCKYAVRPIGNCRNILLNDPLLHTWKCDFNENVAVSVHSCDIVEPISRAKYPILDSQGCALSPFLSSVNQTQPSLSTAHGRAVRFPASPIVFFRCTLRLCKGNDCQLNSVCRRKREDKEVKTEDGDYEYSVEFPSVEARKQESTQLPIVPNHHSTGRAIVKPLAIHEATVFPGVNVLVSTKKLGIVGQKDAKEMGIEITKLTKEEEQKPLNLIVFGKSGDIENVTPRTLPTTNTITSQSFPTLLTESTTVATTEEPETPWEVDIIVESDPILVQFSHETFITNCNRN